MNTYYIEKVKNPDGSLFTGEERFFGDHAPEFLEIEQYGWVYPKKKALEHKKEMEKDGSVFRLKKV